MALSSRSPALGVTQQVWSFGSPDFPQTSFRYSATAYPYSLLYLVYWGMGEWGDGENNFQLDLTEILHHSQQDLKNRVSLRRT